MDEREFFDERPDKKPATLNCPHCHQTAEYDVQWLVRTKKKSLPPRADDRDRAKFAKAKSYMLRRDDMMVCKNMRCRKRFEISGVQSVAFLDSESEMRQGVDWVRLAVFVLILLSFVRRIFKARTGQAKIPPTMRRPTQGKKNDFRDVPPPPENPELG